MTGSPTVKKGRHRRYEEARALKRGPDLDIEALFTDLEGEPIVQSAVVQQDLDDDIEADLDVDASDDPGEYEDDIDESGAPDSESSSEFD
ncbi:MAG: hypothetical protein F2518_04955 [Actinobacteria bacterium]|nr:hypothetical protein [Actinomycetota bacterium]